MKNIVNTIDYDSERPLITFLLMSYNQEQFIREAVTGAFEQTYSPLEILLTDDCSTDRTFEIMNKMAATYQGPHKIVLNRNTANLGIGAHINRAMKLVKGELIVAAAGDDVSLPERTTKLYEEWHGTGRSAYSLFSDARLVDEDGQHLKNLFAEKLPQQANSLEEAIKRGGIGVAGCTHIFSRKTFDVFGPMDDQVMAEDMVIPFRSLLLGNISFVAAPLVLYRVHGGNVSMGSTNYPSHAKRRREVENQRAVMHTWLNDVRKASSEGIITTDRGEKLRDLIVANYFWSMIELKTYNSPFFAVVVKFLYESARRFGKMVDKRLRTAN